MHVGGTGGTDSISQPSWQTADDNAQLTSMASNAEQATNPASSTDAGTEIQEQLAFQSMSENAASTSVSPSLTLTADKATQMPEQAQGARMSTARGLSPSSLQALALALVLCLHQKATMQTSPRCSETNADATQQCQAPTEQAAATAVLGTSLDKKAQDAGSHVQAQGHHTGQPEAAAEEAAALASSHAAIESELKSTRSLLLGQEAKVRHAEVAIKESASQKALLEDTQAELQKARSHASAQEAFAKQAGAVHEEAVNQICSLQVARDQAVEKCSALEQELQGSAERLKVAEAAAQDAALDISNLQAAKDEAAAKCLTLQQQDMDNAQALQALEATVAATNCQRSRVEEQVDAMNKHVTALTDAHAQLPQQYDEAFDTTKQFRGDIKRTIELAEKQTCDLLQARKKHEEMQQQIRQDRAALQNAGQSNQYLAASLERCKHDLAVSQAALSSERHAAAAAKRESEQLQQQLTQHLSQSKALQQQLQQTRTERANLAAHTKSYQAWAENALAQLSRSKSIGDHTIAAHLKASAAKDASIKEASARLADATKLVRLRATLIELHDHAQHH